jgi:hypothetical protein
MFQPTEWAEEIREELQDNSTFHKSESPHKSKAPLSKTDEFLGKVEEILREGSGKEEVEEDNWAWLHELPPGVVKVIMVFIIFFIDFIKLCSPFIEHLP